MSNNGARPLKLGNQLTAQVGLRTPDSDSIQSEIILSLTF